MATELPATQTKRILVVEDEPMIRMLLEDMLGELGYTIAAEAARIEEALEATKNADFDLAILDAEDPVLCSRHDAHFRLLSAQEKTLAFMGARVSRPDGVRGWGGWGHSTRR
jgi:CheY-like chemotaxis protein